MWRQAGWLAKKHGVSRITIGNWIRDNKYAKVELTRGGHYRVWIEEPKQLVGYARVSSRKQAASLQTQSEIIRRAYAGIEIISDIGSGFNFKRPGFKAILERCLSGVAISIVVASGDRLTRSGFQFIRWAVEQHGGNIVELEAKPPTDNFDTEELIRFITCFIASYHGKRSYSRKKSKSIPE